MAGNGKRVVRAVLLLAALAVVGPASSAEGAYVHTLGSTFNLSPAGEPAAVAVDNETGSVYVLNAAEGPNAGTIQKFDSAGNPSNFSSLGTNVLNAKCKSEYEENQCVQIAVDNSGGENQGTIYVSTNISIFEENFGVNVFNPSGAFVAQITNHSEAIEAGEVGTFGAFCGVTTGINGSVYVAHIGSQAPSFSTALVDKYEPEDWDAHPTQVPTRTATLTYLDFAFPCKSAVDANGAIHLIRGFGFESFNALRRFPAAAFGPPSVGRQGQASTVVDALSSDAAIDLANNNVYSDRKTEIARIDETGSLLETFGGSPQVTTSLGVAVNGSTKNVYASNRSSGNVSIYTTLTTPDLIDVAAEPSSPSSVLLSGEVDPLGAGNVTSCEFEYKVSTAGAFTSVPCTPATQYTGPTSVSASVPGLIEGVPYRYRLLASNANGTTVGPIGSFKIEPPSVEGAFVTDLTATSAVLHAEVDPNGAATKYRFEYGTSAAYGLSVPVPDAELAPSDGPQAVSIKVTGLDPQFGYHFRVVASNAVGTAASDDQSFNFLPPNCPNATVRQQSGSSYLPDCRGYELVSPRNAGSVLLLAGGGITAPYASDPPRLSYQGAVGAITGTDPPNGGGFTIDTYVATRTNAGWVTTFPGIPGSKAGSSFVAAGNLGLDTFISFAGDISPPAAAPFVSKTDGTPLGRWPANLDAIANGDQIHGAFQPSPDFSHMAFSSNNVPFVPNGLVTAPGSAYDYDVAAGTTKLISKLPDGENIPQEPGNLASADEVISFVPNSLRPATINPPVSTDGSHILMSTAAFPVPSFELAPVHLYMRVGGGGPGGITYDVSRGAYVNYVDMTADGEEVFFTTAAPVTADDNDTSVDLFRWSEDGDVVTRISAGGGGSGDTDTCSASWTSKCGVTVPLAGGGGADRPISANSGDIYFYSPEQLDGGKGIAGQRNLYLYRDGTVRFVTTAQALRMQVSPGGEHMAFIAREQLTSYDNAGFTEMYTYEPSTGKLRCVSCIPGGTPPIDDTDGSRGGLFMSDDGRTFFYTSNALVPQDTNKLHDIYEFVDGRPQLITTGTGSLDRQVFSQEGNERTGGLQGVSADGVDVYFSTFDVLIDIDENGEFLKFYDARTNGGFPLDPPLQPCVAADECHGRGSTPPSPSALVSEGNLGAGGNVRTVRKHGKKSKASKKRRRHRHGKQRKHG